MLQRVVLPRIGSVLATRAARSPATSTRAEQMRKDAEVTLAATRRRLRKPAPRAGAMATEARAVLKAETDKAKTQLDAELARQVAAAEGDIAQARARALQAVRGVAADVAAEVVLKATGERVSPVGAHERRRSGTR